MVVISLGKGLRHNFGDGLRRRVGFHAPRSDGNAHRLHDGQANAGNRIARGMHVDTGLENATRAANRHEGEALQGVGTGIAGVGRIQDERPIKQRALAFLDGFESLNKLEQGFGHLVAEPLHFDLIAQRRVIRLFMGLHVEGLLHARAADV